MKLIIDASSNEDEIIWEPFGGLFSASLAAHWLKRKAYAAEFDERVFEIGVRRFSSLQHGEQKEMFELYSQTLLSSNATN
jgi:DNA modification methylase